jgi:DNA-directed RNA polymerase II subunit RPB2
VRELFNGCWKDWRAAVTLTIDRTYRSNEQLYQGAAVFDLFAEGNLMSIFQPDMLNKGIMRGFRGKWGTNAMNEKVGVLQPLARISYLDAMSHTRRVVADFDTGMKTTGPRKLHTSQVGYFCTSETPTGAHIGVTKNMSMMTQYSLGAPAKPVYEWMKMKGGLIPVADTTAPVRATAAVVQINGGTVGFTLDPRGLVRVLKLLKWNACLAPTASVSFNTTERTVRILLDEGRPIRPLWHLSQGAALLEQIPTLMAMPWAALVFGTLPATAGASLRTVRFLDPLGDQPAATFADYEVLAGTAGFIEYCDPVEMNEAYVSWWGSAEELTPDHTHAEIHPSTLTGLMASMIPYSNHNQAPRNQLSNSQSKQGIGLMATNIKDRFDTYSHQLCYGEAPLCRTFMYETIGNGEMPYGFNCVIAATSETGYNQDDGLIINRDSVARGMFQSLAFRSYDCAEEVDPRTKVHSHVANPGAVPSWTSLRPGLDYSKLDERGIIREGEVVDAHTVLVGRYMVIPDTNEVKDASVAPGLYTGGRVDSVVVLHQAEGRLLVKVRVIEMRVPQIGDKFSSRHGQKGTIGMFVSAADLPRTAEGLVPDVMVNPGGLISRMTVAQLVEMVAGRLSVEVAAKLNATTFCNGGDFVRQLGDVLELAGVSRAGDNVLYSGITGEQIRTDIFMCPLYFMRLKHLTDDKVNARGAGKREMRTHQPTGGRANEGGLRIGEMERDSLCAHGVAGFLQESMMKRGDATDFWICNGCGRIPIYNEAEKLFVCPTCDGPITYSGVTPDTLTMLLPTKQSRASFSKIAVPYSLKLLDQELSTFMNAGFRFVTETSVERLKDYAWDWPTVDVNFKPEERDIVAVDINPDQKEIPKPKKKKMLEMIWILVIKKKENLQNYNKH